MSVESAQVEPGKAVPYEGRLIPECDFPASLPKVMGTREQLSGAGTGRVTHESVKSLPAPPQVRRPARRLLISAGISSVGDGFTIVALGLLALRVTSDPRLVTAVFASERMPWVFGQWLARRVDSCRYPARLMVGADIGRAAVLIFTAVTIATIGATIPLLALAGALLGVGSLLHSAARSAILPVVTSGAELARVNGYLSSVEGLGYAAVGPALGGLVFAFGPTLPLAVDALTFAVSAVCLRSLAGIAIAGRDRPHVPSRPKLVRTVMRHPLLSTLLVQSFAVGVAQAIVLATTPLFVRDELGVPAAWYGVFLGCAAIGGIAAGVMTPHLWTGRRHTTALMVGAGLVGGLAYTGMAGQHSALMAAAMLFAYDGTIGIMNTISPTLRLELAPPDARAATATLFRQVILGVQPIGALMAGLLARQYGVRSTITVAGAVLIACFAATALPFRRAVAASGA